jgi:hypothetical protein
MFVRNRPSRTRSRLHRSNSFKSLKTVLSSDTNYRLTAN